VSVPREDTLRRRAWPKLVGLHKFDDKADSDSSSNTAVDTDREMAASSAQIQDAMKRSAWRSETSKSSPSPSSDLLCESLDVEQIDRDAARCTWHLLSGTQRYRRFQYRHKSSSKKVAAVLKRKQKRLANLINFTLVQSYHEEDNSQSSDDANGRVEGQEEVNHEKDDVLRYFQGYHDVASIFLSTLGGGGAATSSLSTGEGKANLQRAAEKQGLGLSSRVLKQVSFSHFRDAMRSSFGHLQNALRLVLFPLLHKLDREVHDYLFECSMEPFFCLSWVLTWFSHDVRDTELVKRLFDAFLVSHPLLPIYVTIAMVLHPYNRQWILSTECDFASLHHVLASLPRNSSAVGWKLRLGPDGFEGYVSDNENEDDDDRFSTNRSIDGDASTGRTATTITTDQEFSIVSCSNDSVNMSAIHDDDDRQADDDDHTIGDMSRSVGPIGCIPDASVERVPFQDLIDRALVYMQRYPPKSLAKIAELYFCMGSPTSEAEEMLLPPPSLDMVPSTVLLNPAPKWSIAATAKADWVLKQRARAQLGKKAMSRKDKRRKRRAEARAAASQLRFECSSVHSSHTTTSAYGTFGTDHEDDDTVCTITTCATRQFDPDYLKKHTYSRAVVASGNGGPGEDEDDDHHARRRKYRLWTNVVMVGFVAVSVMAVIQYHRTNFAS